MNLFPCLLSSAVATEMRLEFFAALACFVLRCDSCTTLVAGRLATTDGSTLAAHTDDGLTDPRIMYIPARSYAPNSVRGVFPSPEVYPRYVGYDRGPFYHPLQGQNLSQALGYIPEVQHTFAYLQGTYGIMNEHGLGIAESTCSGGCARSPVDSN
jgi:dipeptidase